jgi:hypothetical protein
MSGINGINNDVTSSIHTPAERFGTGAKVGNVKLPNFSKMYTKTEPSRSDEELKEAIAKMAREDAEKGQLQSPTKEFWDLRKEYISSVSPDRESIITNSTKQIFANVDSIKSRATTLLELLMDKDKKITITNMNGDMYGKACIESDKLNYVEFYNSNKEIIATYDNKQGWSVVSTKAEAERKKEFYSTYNEEWISINAQKNTSVPKHLEGGTTIDAYA